MLRRVTGISGSLTGQKLWWNRYLTPVVNFGEVPRAQLAKSTLLTFSLMPLFIPIKTATSVAEFAMEDLPLGRIPALVPEFAVKDLPLGRTLMTIYIYIYICIINIGSKLHSFLRKRCFLFCFVHIVLLILLDIMRKHFYQYGYLTRV